jgi:hypothetical protein
MSFKRFTKECTVLVEQVSVGVACALKQLRRPLNVTEQEGDGATGRR